MLLKPTKIRSYVAAMRRRGISVQAVLAGTEIAEPQLQDAALLVDQRQRERVILNMLRLTGSPALGLELGTHAQLVDFGVLAYAQMSCRCIREAFNLWVRYSQLVGTTTPIHLHESDDDWGIVYDHAAPMGAVDWFGIEEMVGMGASLGPALAGSSFELAACTFSYAAPPHAQRYEALLGCPVRFGAQRTSLIIRSPHMDLPLPCSDPEFHQICLRHMSQVVRQIGREQPTTSRLRSLLVSRSGAPPTLQEAAAFLGTSPRTLRRHLLQENSSYQGLLDQVRLELARDYLQIERRPVKEVSYELGYHSVRAFRRAFRSWTGRSVQEFLAHD